MSSGTLNYRILELSLILSTGEKLDIAATFEEINLYDNLFSPCMSASIVIRESSNIFEQIKIGKLNEYGTSKVRIYLDKFEGNDRVYQYRKEFIIYKITNRTNLNSTSQIYTLNLVNEDFLYSLQKKINQNYQGIYSTIVEKILKDYLRVPSSSDSTDFFKSKIAEIVPSITNHEINLPNLTPFDAINFITKRTTSTNNRADYLFFENKNGYYFTPLYTLLNREAFFDLNFVPKNIRNDEQTNFLGARELKVLSSFDTLEVVRDGTYTGKFIGFDTVTRTQKILKISNLTENIGDYANDKNNLVELRNKEGKKPFEMAESRIVSYPFEFTRKDLEYITQNYPKMSSFVENTEEYVFQRKSIFTNLMQKRLQLVMPGNFGLFSGSMVTLNVPKFSVKEQNATTGDFKDKTLSGKYIIIGTRHVIQNNKHETIIEIATDSNLS